MANSREGRRGLGYPRRLSLGNPGTPGVPPINGGYTDSSWGSICNNFGSIDRFYARDGAVVVALEFYLQNDA